MCILWINPSNHELTFLVASCWIMRWHHSLSSSVLSLWGQDLQGGGEGGGGEGEGCSDCREIPALARVNTVWLMRSGSDNWHKSYEKQKKQKVGKKICVHRSARRADKKMRKQFITDKKLSFWIWVLFIPLHSVIIR